MNEQQNVAPHIVRLTVKIAELGLTDPEQMRNFAAWALGLRASELPTWGQVKPSDAQAVIERIDAHWYGVAMLDEWRAARVDQAMKETAINAQGADLLGL